MDSIADVTIAQAATMPRFEDGFINLQEVLRQLAESVVNEIMSAEAEQLCEATGNSRNGYRERRLVTCVGTLTLRIPKLRTGSFFPDDVIERYQRVDRAIVAAVSETCATGTSTRKVQKVAQAMGIERLSKDQVSAICEHLDSEVEELVTRPLGELRTPYLWIDATYVKCRRDRRVASTAVVTAIGCDEDGWRRVLGLGVVDTESYDSWLAFLRRIRARGVTGAQLVTSDAHEGLRRAIGEVFQGAADSATALSEMSAKVGRLESEMARLVEMVKLANLRHFAPKSERVPDDQMCLSLFNDAEAWADASEPEPELAGGDGATARPRRRGGRRRIDTSRLERVVVEHDLEDRACPRCGSEMDEMKVEVTEVVRLVPAHLVVEEHRRHVYRCKSCCAANAAGEDVASQIVRAPMPALTPIPGSFATASMLSWVINAKYANATPYYRLEQDFLTLGAEVSRQDMANWTINAHRRWLSLVHARMRERLLECGYLNADETTVQVLREPGREPRRKSYMWLFRSGPHEVPNCIFEYHPTRSGSVPRAFLRGWRGYLTTDGYDPYFSMGLEGVTNTACLVHVRRKFAEIVKAAGGDAACEGADSVALEARRRIDRIFRADSEFDGMGPEARREAREESLRPLMESFREWAEGAIGRAVPGLSLHRALAYALRYWPYVMNVLEDGRLGLDNNIAERAIKPFVIGRKNFLFSDAPAGAEASAAIYSLVVTAKLNGLNRRAYLEWLLTEMSDDDRLSEPGRIDRYLPWSEDVPASCRLTTSRVDEEAALPDEPIVDAKALEAVEGALETR